MNRRNWLKTSACLTAAATVPVLLTSHASQAMKKSITSGTTAERFSEAQIAREWPNLKARLFANENPFGPSEKAKKAIIEAIANSYQYPFVYTEQLTEKIATTESVSKDHILLGAGSTPLLQAAAIMFSKNNGTIVSADPSYDYLMDEASTYFQATWVKVPLTPEYTHDLDAIEKAITNTTTLVYICNPNNPTGTIVDSAKLRSFCERVSKRVPVLIDEAYIDYLPDPKGSSMIDCVIKGHNVIVARTFSKLHGFAGLRVGYCIAQPEMIKMLRPYTTGWGALSATSAHAALASYGDKEFLQDALSKTNESKNYLYKVLKQEGYSYIPSSTNFVMFPLNMDGKRFTDEMMKRGVGVRNWKLNDKDWCRVSIGKMDEMKAFEQAFKQLS